MALNTTEEPTNEVTRAMLVIKALDPDARIELSEYTGKWYVLVRLDISDGTFSHLASPVHHVNPDGAVFAMLDTLKAVTEPTECIRTRTSPGREYRWNGAAFADVTPRAVAG